MNCLTYDSIRKNYAESLYYENCVNVWKDIKKKKTNKILSQEFLEQKMNLKVNYHIANGWANLRF